MNCHYLSIIARFLCCFLLHSKKYMSINKSCNVVLSEKEKTKQNATTETPNQKQIKLKSQSCSKQMKMMYPFGKHSYQIISWEYLLLRIFGSSPQNLTCYSLKACLSSSRAICDTSQKHLVTDRKVIVVSSTNYLVQTQRFKFHYATTPWQNSSRREWKPTL